MDMFARRAGYDKINSIQKQPYKVISLITCMLRHMYGLPENNFVLKDRDWLGLTILHTHVLLELKIT